MKKVTAIILAILILTTISCSIAEDGGFSIRNNVQFGDTIETVKSKDSIFQNEKVSDVVNRMYSDDKVTSQCMAISDLTLGDIDKFILLYYFVDSKLKEITYYANISPFVEYFPYTMDECISLYNDLELSLVNKYGEKMSPDDPRIDLLVSPSQYGLLHHTKSGTIISLDGKNSQTWDYDLFDCAAWLVDYENYFVKIDLIFFHTDDGYGGIELNYYMITKEEYNDLISTYEDQNEKRKENIDNQI